MKIEKTLVFSDLRSVPDLLLSFSAAAGSLKKTVLRGPGGTVYLAGRGSSGNATLFAKYIWETYCGVITNLIHPHSLFEAKKPLNFSAQAVWAFSQSGKSPDIAACLKLTRKWGARGVAITNEPSLRRNALARAADAHILLSRSGELAVPATKSFILQLWAVLWAAQVWSGCFRKKDFAETPDLVRDLLSQPPGSALGNFLKKIKNARMVGFVGRGPYNALADEAALKFREMGRCHALGCSAAEFLHGAAGAFTPRDFVFLLSPGGRLPKDLLLVKKELNRRGTPYGIVTPGKGRFPFNCLLTDIKLKLLALHLALERGLNPDNPKGLKKVTRTF